MLIRRNDSRAFWIFLIWVLILPLFLNTDLAAQDENVEDFAVEEEPVDQAADKPAADKPPSDKAGDEAAGDEVPIEDMGEDTGEPEEPEALPALSADPNELLGKVNGVFRAKKYDEAVEALKDHEDVVETSKELSEIYVESLLNSKKPDWNTVLRAAKMLGKNEKGSSLADYAQGLHFQNKSKPDLAKAITFFGKAKSAKKPHPDAATAYFMALAKKFWMVGLVVLLLPVMVVVKVVKKKKAAKAALELNLEPAGEAAAVDDLQNQLQAAISEEPAAKPDAAKAAKAAEAAPAPTAKPADKQPAAATPAGAKPATPAAPATSATPATPAPPVPSVAPATPPVAGPENAAPVPANIPAQPANAQPVAPAAPPTGPAPIEQTATTHPAPEPAGMTPQSQPQPHPVQPDAHHSQQQPYYSGSLSGKRSAEIEQAKAMISPQRREPVSVDSELDVLWSKLCRKAIQNKIAPQARSSYDSETTRFVQNEMPSIRLGERHDFSSIDPNVSIDLSEEALKDDLIGKLKMLAITDGELRSLLAQKNAKHVPLLIEYVLSKPEPVRLALVTRELGYYNDPAVIDILASLLYNEDHRVALAAIQGLELSKNQQAILHICPFLKSEIPLLAQAARTALANFGAVAILKAFVKLPQLADSRIREAGVFVLSRMKGTQVEQLLVQMLNDDVQEIREKVILAMSYQKNPVYIDPLREFFRIAAGPDKTLARKAIVYLQGFVGKKK
ncbi:MAG: HEAT repeat domain-containing protein [Candidatus Rifleibacteriota bacterium]